MDTQEFAKRMSDIAEIEDDEERHIRADTLLCDALMQLGYEQGIEIYDMMEKRYA